MKIAVIGPLELPKPQGGVTRHCEEIYARIASDGNAVTVVCGGGPAPDDEYRGMRIHHVRTASGAGWERLSYALGSSTAASRGAADVVHYHSFASSALCMLPKLRGRKVVTTAHRVEWKDAKWGPLTRMFLRYCEWAAVRFSDALIAVSQALKDDLVERHPRAARTVVISNGVTRPEPAPTTALDDLGLRANGYLLVVGRLVPEKGVDVAIAAFRELLERADPGLDLVIVGGSRRAGSATERALTELAAPAGGRVHFLGVQDPSVVALLYDHARALLAPSYQEGQPLVVAEAMSAGCCVVASDIAAHLELLDGTGRIVPVGDPHALADAIDWVVAHPGETSALGRDAAARIATGPYSWDTAARATERILTSL